MTRVPSRLDGAVTKVGSSHHDAIIGERVTTEERMRVVLSSVLKVPQQRITADASQLTIGEWDSVAHMRLILAIESEFGVSFDPDEIAGLTSVSAIQAFLAREVGA